MATETPTENKKQPPVILCIGMAGSGKTTFMQVRVIFVVSTRSSFFDVVVFLFFLEN